jgi:cysteinyl-tRNA synthetase
VLRLYDTALGRVEALDRRRPGQLSMYVCGPTVYGEAHIGHGRFNLVWDVIRRYARWRDLDVRYVSNITDIDDKIINRANAEEIERHDHALGVPPGTTLAPRRRPRRLARLGELPKHEVHR